VFTVFVATVSATIYDFKDTVNNTAYEGYDDHKPADVPPDYEAELSGDEYHAINTSDDNRASYAMPGEPSGQYEFHRFKFKINEPISDISQLYVMHEGYGTANNGNGLHLYIWNYTASNWESVGHNSATSDADIDKIYTSGLSNYINASGYLKLLAITQYEAVSCPFYYSYNGTDYILDGEGLLFSPLPWWERSSIVMMENLKPVDGSYKLKVTEELTETSYFDRLSLLVVEHSPDVTVYPDFYNNLYTIRNPIKPISCIDDSGNACMALMEKDDIYWLPQPDFEKLMDTDNDGIIDSYNESDFYKEIVLEFPRPENITHAKLLYRLKEQRFGTVGIWGGMLHALGRNNLDKLRDIYGDQVIEWVLSQMMTLEVWNGTDWVVLHRAADATASTKGNNMVFSLNLTDIDTDNIKIKFKSIVGVQGVDYVFIDYSEDEDIEVTEIMPSAIIGGAKEKILVDDSEYLVLESGDCIYVTFPELPNSENKSRTYLISDNGYYLHDYNNVVNYTGEVEELMNQIFSDKFFASRYFIPKFYAEHYSGHHTIYTDYVKVETYGPVYNLDTGENFFTIQEAINAINTSDGDTIKVNPGVYKENIIINKELRLIGDPIIDGSGDVGIRIQANNTLVENMTVINSSIGIFVYNVSFMIQNVTLNNNTIYDCIHSPGNGIEFWDVNNSVINGSYIYNNSKGIYLFSSNNNTIDTNNVYNNTEDGIYLEFDSNYNTITNNNVSENNNGIALSTVASNNYNDIINNTVNSNKKYGIYLKNGESYNNITDNTVSENEIGICLEDAHYNLIKDNNITDNEHGILINQSSSNTLERNMIMNNTEWDTGVHITEGSDYNEIHENCFYDNEPQAYDDGHDNDWDYNFWSDYPQWGVYDIPGTAGSKDHHTLKECGGSPQPPQPAAVPALTPIGIIALVGLLSVVLAVSISISIGRKR